MFIISWLAVVLHVGWILPLLLAHEPIRCVALAPFFTISQNPKIVALILLVVSVLAVAGKHFIKGRWSLFACLIPQQATLMMTAWSATWCIVDGHYADGVARSGMFFIFPDQWGNIVPCVLHTVYVTWVFVLAANYKQTVRAVECQLAGCPFRQ